MMEQTKIRKKNLRQSSTAFPVYRNKVIENLQRQIANAFNLYLNYKHYQWEASGPMSRDLDIIFDEFAGEAYEVMDDLAKRVSAIGQKRARVVDFPQLATVKPAKKDVNIRQMIEEAISNSSTVIKEIRKAVKNSKGTDFISTNLLSRILKIHEKHEWWLQYILENRHGLKMQTGN